MHRSMLLLLLSCTCAKREPGPIVGDEDAWYRTFGGRAMDEAWGIDRDAGGDLYVSTHQGNPSQADAFIYRLEDNGEIVWETQWGDTWTEEAFAVEEVDGVVHVAGCQFKGVDLWDTKATLIRLDAESGEVLDPVWTYDDDNMWNEIDGIVVTEDAVFLSGWGGSDNGDILLAQLDRQGTQQQLQAWGSSAWEEGNGHMVRVDGRLYVAGRYGADSVWEGGDAVVVALDESTLDEVWRATWGESDSMEDALGLTTDGTNLYVVGIQDGDNSVFFLSYDLDGNLRWQSDWDGGGAEYGRAIRVDEVDGSVVVALNSDASGSKDIVLLRLDASNGQVLEQASWGGSKAEEAHDFILDGDAGFLVGQTRSHGNGQYDAVVLRFAQRPWVMPPD